MLNAIISILAASLRMATPLTFAAIGESISEKSGIINIGLDSIMLSGAFFSFFSYSKNIKYFIRITSGNNKWCNNFINSCFFIY